MKPPVKLPSGLGDTFGILRTFKGRDKEHVAFRKDRFVSSPPTDVGAFLIEVCHDFAVWGVKGSLIRIFMVRTYAQKKLTEILRKRYDGMQ